MGEARLRRETFFAQNPECIFCGGGVAATTKEHCPPRSMFTEKRWPEGFEFPACTACNGGSSNEDLMVSFIANMRDGDEDTLRKGAGLMMNVHRQFPGFLPSLFPGPIEARRINRRMGLTPAPGRTHQQTGVANVTPEMAVSVRRVGLKLIKAIYFMQTKRIFPSKGGVLFSWFTNAQLLEHGRIDVLDAFSRFAAINPPTRRTGKELKHQFDYRYSVDDTAELHALQVAFGPVLGFVAVFSQIPGRLEAINDSAVAQSPENADLSAFKWLSTNIDSVRLAC